MFTGLIQDIGHIADIEQNAEGATLWISTNLDMSDWELGESVACNGACLTVTAMKEGRFSVDCALETLRVTTMGQATKGTKLHLERAMQIGDRLGGHLVSGHVDDMGTVRSIRDEGNSRVIEIEIPEQWRRYFIPKGSISVDGVSLTVHELLEDSFVLWIIPHTLEKTHLGEYRPGTRVHLEVDQVGKYIERMLAPWRDAMHKTDGIDIDFLKQHGFV